MTDGEELLTRANVGGGGGAGGGGTGISDSYTFNSLADESVKTKQTGTKYGHILAFLFTFIIIIFFYFREIASRREGQKEN